MNSPANDQALAAPQTSRPDAQKRIQVALLFGVLATLGCYGLLLRHDLMAGDFTWALRGVRLYLQGINPYTAGGYPNGLPLFYPAPALFVTLPFAWLPDMWAGALFFGLSSGILAWALYPKGWHYMLVFASTPYISSMILAQWSPLMMAACLIPWMCLLVVCKPNFGIMALTQHRPPPWAMGVAVGALTLSLVLLPNWPREWWVNTRQYTPVAPLPLVIRLLLLSAFLQWKKPEARILGLLAILPHQPYDLVVLWLMPRNLKQALILTGFSWIAYLIWLDNHSWSSWLCGLLLYLPALAFVWLPNKEPFERVEK